MKIRICCGEMKSYYIDNSYIRLHEYPDEKREIVIDTAIYDENEVEIDYCPFCGKRFEVYSEENIKRINSILEEMVG